MGFTRSETDIRVHQSLGDYPKVDDGVSTEELKKKFDLPAETLQRDLNKLEVELEDVYASAKIGAKTLDSEDKSANTVQAKLELLRKDIQQTTLGQIADNTITKAKMESSYEATIAKKDGTEQINLNANKLQGKTVENILNDAEANKPYVVGTYTGDDVNGKVIELGFTPQAVMLNCQNKAYLWYGALAITGSPKQGILSITTNGFKVYLNDSATSSNSSGQVYHYIAFK